MWEFHVMKVLYLSEVDERDLEILLENLSNGIEVTAIPPSRKEEAVERASEFDAVIGARLGRDFLEAANNLKYFVIPFAGIPPQDKQVLPDFPNLKVFNSHFNAVHVAEHAWALLLASAKRLCPVHEEMRRGDWSARYRHELGTAVSGKILLVIGYGSIGRAVARIAKAFGMSVKAIKRTPAEDPEIDFLGTKEDLPKLLPGADFIVLALPDSRGTKGFLGGREFGLMKEGVHIVNVGRGGTIDEDAFYDALKSGKVGGAGIDTWWVYPPDEAARSCTFPSRNPFWEFDNVVFSPHRASHVRGREEDRMKDVAGILNSIAHGEPLNMVDVARGY
jgi:phosphoglycerate dehydrogenase-like enzyme